MGLYKRVRHPETQVSLGYLVQVLGRAQIVEIHPEASYARFVDSYSEIEPGDRLIPYEELPMEFTKVHSEEQVEVLPGVFTIKPGIISPGPTPSLYGFTRRVVHRNLYRIPSTDLAPITRFLFTFPTRKRWQRVDGMKRLARLRGLRGWVLIHNPSPTGRGGVGHYPRPVLLQDDWVARVRTCTKRITSF